MNRPLTRSGQRRPEKGFALISAIAFLVLLLGFGGAMIQQTIQELHRAGRAKKETRAFNLAEAGIDYGAWQLYNEPTTSLPTSWSRTDLQGGTFTVNAASYDGSSDTVVLTSTGNSQGYLSQVKVVGVFLGTTEEGQSPVFDHALFSDADMVLTGTFDITGDVHSNGNVTCQGGPSVDGDLSAVGSIAVQGSSNVTGSVSPGAEDIGMPTIDLAYYRSVATTVYTGNTTFASTTTLDGVTYVEGDVNISGQIQGTGVIVADGNVIVNGSVTLENPSDDEFAIVSTGTVTINGTCRIEGWIYTHNVSVPSEFTGSGTAEIVGGVAADVINCNGTLAIEYCSPSVDLPGSSSSPAQFDAISWRRLR
jgi:cytoskeletal protein CcmA (bactofilin family)